jgi:hypothetical protein
MLLQSTGSLNLLDSLGALDVELVSEEVNRFIHGYNVIEVLLIFHDDIAESSETLVGAVVDHQHPVNWSEALEELLDHAFADLVALWKIADIQFSVLHIFGHLRSVVRIHGSSDSHFLSLELVALYQENLVNRGSIGEVNKTKSS